jgi:hypothetical protein
MSWQHLIEPAMPSRLFVIAIVVFWLGTLGWVFQREILPQYQAGEPPTLYLDVQDEVGGRIIQWEVFMGEDRVGTATTTVRALPDQTFAIHNKLKLDTRTGLFRYFLSSEDTYRVRADGSMLGFRALVKLSLSQAEADVMNTLLQLKFKAYENELEILGKVTDGVVEPRLRLNKLPVKDNPLFNPQPIELPHHGSVFNILHPQNKIHGLYEGRSWLVPVFSPLAFSSSIIASSAPAPLRKTAYLATVADDELSWLGETVPCWRVDVGDPASKPICRVWVRKSDSLVLQHEARHETIQLVLKRVKIK